MQSTAMPRLHDTPEEVNLRARLRERLTVHVACKGRTAWLDLSWPRELGIA